MSKETSEIFVWNGFVSTVRQLLTGAESGLSRPAEMGEHGECASVIAGIDLPLSTGRQIRSPPVEPPNR